MTSEAASDPAGRRAANDGTRNRPTVLQADPPNRESSIVALGKGLTPNGSFFTRSHFPVPIVEVGAWRLSVDGSVERPTTLSWSDLQRWPHRSLRATLECAGNGRRGFRRPVEGELMWGDCAVSNGEWTGVPLSRLLASAVVLPGATEVVFEGIDRPTEARSAGSPPFGRSLPLEVATGSDDVLLATALNGEPLDFDHGFPVRLVVPGWYGMAWVKWLTRIRVQQTRFEGRFQTEKYVYRYDASGPTPPEPVATMRVKSLVTSHTEGERIPRGRSSTLRGRAWSGTGSITHVEVLVDDAWTPALVTLGESSYEWASWELPWNPARGGRHEIQVRATDSSGATQPMEPIHNEHQYGFNAVQRLVLEVI